MSEQRELVIRWDKGGVRIWSAPSQVPWHLHEGQEIRVTINPQYVVTRFPAPDPDTPEPKE